MARIVLLIIVTCVAGCSQSDHLPTSRSAIPEVITQTDNKGMMKTDINGMIKTNFEPKLWPISVEGKWGFIDETGTVKIQPQFAAAEAFNQGLAIVSVPGTSEADLAFKRNYDGFIDDSGEFVIPAAFPSFYNNREDYDRYGYSSFEDGVAVVMDATSSDGIRGLIDRTGKLMTPMKFHSLGDFGEGLCRFEIHPEFEYDHEKYQRGYMDYRGNVVIRPEGFLYGSSFSEGRAVITVRNDQGDHELMIDRQGNVVVGPGQYTAISGVMGGLARVVKDDEVGLIDRDGRVFVPLGEYDQIMEPAPGTTYIGEKAGVYYAIRSEAKPTKLPDFGAEPMSYRGDLIWIKTKNGKDGFAKPDGTMVVDPVFDDLSYSFDGELCKFYRGSERGYVNRSGKIVWSTKNWELPLQYSIREPLQSYLPNFGLEAIPLSYNWDCENAIVFVCDGKLQQLRKYYLDKRSAEVKVNDFTDYKLEPGKLKMMISFEGVAFLEVFAMHGDQESKDAEDTDYFVSFYHCENMNVLRKKFPGKTIGIILEN